ncbi:MAG TPA: hypothetical protein PK052_04745 [Anaerohalosphaeraceae bacterium]|nr:hypothetical protein [Anaerohalosphaeraceae bacterium]HOM76052.1 hypothetical protein [Anaerohalosphaeraceae bacterium]HPC64273.1 hypothetical protein [Anaerohalosphaeraceae bacterium]HPO70667.1 hypothetical protein [Anaerohalosphaeraceae bacterium]HRS71329.1 hypothetical protein [Anaerohalosphaeraceae bacterium]
MTISCTCPQCGRVCGFKDQYAGRRARCLACNARFIIPAADGAKAVPVQPSPQEPLPGFFRAALADNFSVFIQKESLFGIILSAALIAFHFFAGNADYSFTVGHFRPPLIVGWIVTFGCAGYLLWYCMEIINSTFMDNDFLPDIFVGTGFAFLGESVKNIYLFIAAAAAAAIPGSAITALLEIIGLTHQGLQTAIVLLSLTMWPMMLAMLGSGAAPWELFRYDRIIRMIAKTAGAYLLTASVTFAALLAVYVTVGLFAQDIKSSAGILAALAARLAAAGALLFAMRTIGLYARHYFRCFPELFPS